MYTAIRNKIKVVLLCLAIVLFIGMPIALVSGFWTKGATEWIIILIFGLPIIFLIDLVVGKIVQSQNKSDNKENS